MDIKIDEALVRTANQCTKNLRCLDPSCQDLCEVKHCVQGKVHFVECLDMNFCSYQMSFGSGTVCNCPVRKEIYNRYGL
ncbi:MAG: hypothetical protein HY899_18505 [Deltaproteobacteria bacterium]|nr:hypothetical protein [Deltaproteobacteria bacterium]